MGIAPRKLWDMDTESYLLLAAWAEYESDLNELGFLRSETMTAEANPDNPEAGHNYVAESAGLDYSLLALEQAKQAFKDDPNPARRFTVRQVERPSRL